MTVSEIGHNSGYGDDVEEARAGNWFAVSRDVFAHHIVGIHNRPYTEFEAWLSLLAMASYETRKVQNKGRLIILDPGDLMAAHSFLAERWMWTVDKVRWFLKRLATEAMITRALADQNAWDADGARLVSATDHTSQNTKRNTNQIQIITISNYSLYQVYRGAQHQAKRQPEQQPSTNRPPTVHQESNKVTNKQEYTPPTPQRGADEDSKGLFADIQPETPKTVATKSDVAAAFEVYDLAAGHFGFARCNAKTEARKKRLEKRLADLGGLDNFKSALRGLGKASDPFVKFLRGKTTTRPGEDPFRLDIDRLLSTNTAMGDVLAKLFDLEQASATASTPPAWKTWTRDEWLANVREHANGTWPSSRIGFWPGHPKAEVPPDVVAELGLEGKYDHRGIKIAK